MAGTPSDPGAKRGHTLADHQYGEDYSHRHDGDDDADHDHDSVEGEGALEDNPIWIQDHVTLSSIGIDIGSSGTQVVFSRLALRRFGEDLSSRYFVVSRDTLHRSPVTLTPYLSEELIDAAGLGVIIDAAYASAGLHPDDIDAGVVILTGEALRRENAQAIADVLAEQGGEFVCATAGHHMEAMLAAYGSGAARASHDLDRRILNIDIGGGTTKLALVEDGRILATAAVHVGGRLQVVDENHVIQRLDPAGKSHAARAGFDWKRGDTVSAGDLDRVAEGMADALVAALLSRPLPPAIERLYLTDPILDFGAVDGIMLSGGVAEYVYGREDRDFADLGKRLGAALRRRIDQGLLPWPLLPAGECIRATALGASEYSVQLSGSTCYISSPGELLPRRNLQVLQPEFTCGEMIDPDALAAAIRARFTAFDRVEGEGEAALAFRWSGAPSYERISAFARGIVRGLASSIERRLPLYIMLDGDVAQTLGALLREELGVQSEILAIDGVTLWDLDYIDLGRIRLPSQTVPVTVKSLVFSEDPRLPRADEHEAHDADHHDDAHGHHDHVDVHHHHDHDHPHEHHHDHGHRSGKKF